MPVTFALAPLLVAVAILIALDLAIADPELFSIAVRSASHFPAVQYKISDTIQGCTLHRVTTIYRRSAAGDETTRFGLMSTVWLKRNSLPLRGWIVGAVLISAVVVLGYRTQQTVQHLKAVQGELESTKEQAAHAKSEAAELQQAAENLRLQLAKAEAEIQRLTEAADRAKAEASERETQMAKLREGVASCDEFFEKWEGNTSAPNILAIFGITREAAAAKDCLDKGDVATACKHWQGLLVQIEKLGSPVKESRVEIEELLRLNHCKKYVGSARPVQLAPR